MKYSKNWFVSVVRFRIISGVWRNTLVMLIVESFVHEVLPQEIMRAPLRPLPHHSELSSKDKGT